jgi:hypothetical protein
MIRKLLLVIISLFTAAFAFAQKGETIEMADTMRQNGKIYVVVAVVLTILIGIILYLVRLDRKITKLEKDNHFITK